MNHQARRALDLSDLALERPRAVRAARRLLEALARPGTTPTALARLCRANIRATGGVWGAAVRYLQE